MKCIEILEPKERKVLAQNSRIQNTYRYSIHQLGVKLEMCKIGFLHTLQIKDKPLRTVVEKMKSGQLHISDQRGKHHNRPKRIPLVKKNAVIAHIRTFPTRETHYARMNGNPQRLYLDPSLSISSMYNSYIEQCRANNAQAYEVEESQYRIIFYTFKLSFGNPKQDTCDQCDKFRVQIMANPGENSLVLARDLHQAHGSLIINILLTFMYI